MKYFKALVKTGTSQPTSFWRWNVEVNIGDVFKVIKLENYKNRSYFVFKGLDKSTFWVDIKKLKEFENFKEISEKEYLEARLIKKLKE